MCARKEIRVGSALMAIGTLLCVKTVGGHSEHVVALNADAMDDAGATWQCLIFCGMRRSGWVLGHEVILTYERNDAQEGGAESISSTRETIS
jgi:hypothetical protein